MDVVRAHFGEWLSLYPGTEGRVVYRLDGKSWFFGEEPREAAFSEYEVGLAETVSTPFERADFGGGRD